MISRRIPTFRLFRARMPWLAGALAFALILLGGGSPAAEAGREKIDPTEIHVSGTASTSVMPDTATVVVAVETEGKTAPAAQEENARRIQDVVTELSMMGIRGDDIKTANFRLVPIRSQTSPHSSEPPVIVGYRVSHDVRVKVTSIDRVGAVLDAAVRGGANRVSHIEFSVSDAHTYRDELLRAAVADAQAKAVALAEAAGLSLIGPSRITESSYTPFLAKTAARMAVPDAAFVETEIMPDEQQLSVHIDVTFLAESAL